MNVLCFFFAQIIFFVNLFPLGSFRNTTCGTELFVHSISLMFFFTCIFSSEFFFWTIASTLFTFFPVASEPVAAAAAAAKFCFYLRSVV